MNLNLQEELKEEIADLLEKIVEKSIEYARVDFTDNEYNCASCAWGRIVDEVPSKNSDTGKDSIYRCYHPKVLAHVGKVLDDREDIIGKGTLLEFLTPSLIDMIHSPEDNIDEIEKYVQEQMIRRMIPNTDVGMILAYELESGVPVKAQLEVDIPAMDFHFKAMGDTADEQNSFPIKYNPLWMRYCTFYEETEK